MVGNSGNFKVIKTEKNYSCTYYNPPFKIEVIKKNKKNCQHEKV